MVLSFSFGFKGSEVRRSGFSPAAGQKTAGQIEKETLKKKISNNEVSYERFRVLIIQNGER